MSQALSYSDTRRGSGSVGPTVRELVGAPTQGVTRAAADGALPAQRRGHGESLVLAATLSERTSPPPRSRQLQGGMYEHGSRCD